VTEAGHAWATAMSVLLIETLDSVEHAQPTTRSR